MDSKPNQNFLYLLQSMDPLLDIRWGGSIGQWVVERKAYVPETELRFLTRRKDRLEALIRREPEHKNHAHHVKTLVGVSEELNSGRRGYRVIIFSPVLNQRLYDQICSSDIKRYGGYSRYADEMEAQEMAAARDQERVQQNNRMETHGEVHSMLDFMWRKRETQLLHGERNLTKLLHGDHAAQRKKANARDKAMAKRGAAEPLIQLASH